MAFTANSLRRGDRGDNVRKLQARLNRDYPEYSDLDEDGDFGAKTEMVVREFQRRSGLPDSGIADAATLARLGLTSENGDDKSCGDGLLVSPTTSCEFARNVRAGYFAVPGDSVEIDVFSPATQKTYRMACVRTGDRVTCRGGNAAVVTFHF
ncbi:peptidoglycan-binding domain-containing protein [Mycolicibacterium sp. XJ870]